MLTVTVFKERDAYERDLHKTFKRVYRKYSAQEQNDAWAEAKRLTSKIAFTQYVRLHTAFFGKKAGDPKQKMWEIGHDIAQGRAFSVHKQ